LPSPGCLPENEGSLQQDQTITIVLCHDIFCNFKLLADILKGPEHIYREGFNGRAPVHGEFAVMRIRALSAKCAILRYQCKRFIIPRQEELSFQSNGPLPNLHLLASLLMVIPVELSAFDAPAKQQSLFVFVQKGSHLVRRRCLGRTTPAFPELFSAVFTFHLHPIRYADVLCAYEENFIDTVLLADGQDRADNISAPLEILQGNNFPLILGVALHHLSVGVILASHS